MKIVCVGRNYLAHVEELDRELPSEPLFFIKPETALLPPDTDFRYPGFSAEVHYETELVIRVGKTGRDIPVGSARDYYDAVSVGVDFTARDLQRAAIAKGLPWEPAKAFDGSAPVGAFLPVASFAGRGGIGFGMLLNGVAAQRGDSGDMIFGFDAIVAHVSRFVTLCEGDLIFTGTPRGVGEVRVGDRLELFLDGRRVSSFAVR